MAAKSSIKARIATVGIIALTLVILALNFLSEKATSGNIVKNVLADIVLLICVFLLVAILLMRAPDYDKKFQHK